MTAGLVVLGFALWPEPAHPNSGTGTPASIVTPQASVETPSLATTASIEAPAPELRPRLKNGPWATGHVQGIAVDQTRGYIYYSFTTLLVKTDLAGAVVGTVGGFTGHLGDLDFNPSDGRVYGSLEYNEAKATYVAIFDVDRISRVGMRAQNSSIVSTVYLPEVVKDYEADLNHDGRFAGDRGNTRDHRYGCSGIDGVSFGPAFGSTAGPMYLTIAYGIYGNVLRNDNDHQVVLQYDVSDWAKYEHPLVEGKPHRFGPQELAGKYFVYTGNTNYGVQNLDYDPWLKRWFLAVYPGSKPRFPNYALFAIDARAKPELRTLHGLGGERGLELPLANDGLTDSVTGIRGWRRNTAFGIQSLGGGHYYLVASTSAHNKNIAIVTMESWTGDSSAPLAPVPG